MNFINKNMFVPISTKTNKNQELVEEIREENNSGQIAFKEKLIMLFVYLLMAVTAISLLAFLIMSIMGIKGAEGALNIFYHVIAALTGYLFGTNKERGTGSV